MKKHRNCRRRARLLTLAAVAALPLPAAAVEFDLPLMGDSSINGRLNTTFTAGVGIRMQDRATELVGKGNINPAVCENHFQGCQGLFMTQAFPAQRLAAAPGALSMRVDDGNLNYDRYELFQGVTKVTQDLTLEFGTLGLFAKWLYFYDFVNNRFEETYPNRITAQNVNRTGVTGDPVYENRYFARTYGPGERLTPQRTDGEALRQAGTDLQLLDLHLFGEFMLPGETTFIWKLGRQTVNWGESTLLAINSLNQANPVNANNLFRVGFAVEEVFTPVGMVFGSFEPFTNTTLEGFYQYEWTPVEIPTPGTFFSFADIGTNYVNNWVNLSFGSAADDPDGVGHPLWNPLTLITPTTAKTSRLPDLEARDSGQFGIAVKYFSETLNNGTEFGFYYMRYHSKLPYVSFFATDASCARREGNEQGIDANSPGSFLLAACPNVPGVVDQRAAARAAADIAALFAARPDAAQDLGSNPADVLAAIQAQLLSGGDPNAPLDDAVPLHTGFIRLEYPEDIDLLGVSFNTTLGDYSIQGEVAYRPDMPLQVAIMDLAFAAAGPTLSRCHDPALQCTGTTAGSGYNPDGTFGTGNYDNSDQVVDAQGTPGAYDDTFNLFIGGLTGSARSFPNFIIPYRGGVVGETPPNAYIRGWEHFDVFQYNFGTTRVLGATDNFIGADQVNILFEFGATHVPGLPPLDELQIEAPGIYTSATAGADGTGADRSRQACSTSTSCTFGPDGGRFNPTQAPLTGYVDRFSWGYRVITQIKYESLFAGISVQPLIILAHDVKGTAPGPGENFVEGRKSAIVLIETRYQDALSFNVGYTWFTGGGQHNLLRDRDNAQFFVKYQF